MELNLQCGHELNYQLTLILFKNSFMGEK
jgi:hypothetical protein